MISDKIPKKRTPKIIQNELLKKSLRANKIIIDVKKDKAITHISKNNRMENITLKSYTLDTFHLFNNNDYIKKFNFVTENSKDIPIKLIKFAVRTILRYKVLSELNLILKNPDLAVELEKGIFEFSLIHVLLNNLNYQFVEAVYDSKVFDIMTNLDQTQQGDRLINKTLLPAILLKKIKAQFVAFLSPEQLHPEHWYDMLKKKHAREKAENTMATTDMYKCYRCGERKCKITQSQTRCADEGITTIIVCLVCYATFTK